MQPISKQRNSNLELYRIIVMMLIVAHHYVVNSGLMSIMASNPSSQASTFYYIMGMWGKTGINCFVMITGYYMCKSNITFRKFLKLFLEVIFYNITIYLVFCFTNHDNLTLLGFAKAIVPFRLVTDDFVSCFLWFYLFIPFLNKTIRCFDKQTHLWFIILLFSLYTIVGTIPNAVRMNYVEWFCVIYMIASYIRLYKVPKYHETIFWGIMSILTIVVAIVSVIILAKAYKSVWIPLLFVADCNKIMSVFVAVCSFMYFKNLHLPYNKIINTIAASTFAVLLIHANCNTMRHWLWKDIFDSTGHYHSPYYGVYAISVVIIVFFACILIDIIRINIIEKPTFKIIDKYVLK